MIRKSDLFGTLQRGLLGVVTSLDVPGDVLDHDDGVIDHKAGRDRERHQRKIIEAEAIEIHHRERADERQRHRKAGNQGRGQIAQEQKDHQDNECDGNQ